MKNHKAFTVILSVFLLLVLAAGGYFGLTFLLTERNPMDILTGGSDVPTNDMPTDAEGNNLTGNSMQNLYAGGLLAMQGKDLFYANPSDGGSLYCRARNGEITKLTDFPVANLNISGEKLVFTDLAANTIIRSDGVMGTYSAASHQELWDLAGDEDRIRFGGNLYYILGIKTFCAGEITYNDLIIAKMESELYYQSPVMLEGGDLLVFTVTPEIKPNGPSLAAQPAAMRVFSLSAQPESFSAIPLAVDVVHIMVGDSISIENPTTGKSDFYLDTSAGDSIQSAAVVGGGLYVETINADAAGERGNNTISVIDRATGRAVASIPGHTVQTDGKDLYFINKGSLFKLLPGSGIISQVSDTIVRNTGYKINPNGSVEYQSYDSQTGKLVDMISIPTDRGYVTTVNGQPVTLPEPLKNAHQFGDNIYAWDTEAKGWVRIDPKDIKDGKMPYTPTDWGDERRDIDYDRVRLMPPGEIGKLYSDEPWNNERKELPTPGPSPDPFVPNTWPSDDYNTPSAPSPAPSADTSADPSPNPSAAPSADPTPPPAVPSAGNNTRQTPVEALDALVLVLQGNDFDSPSVAAMYTPEESSKVIQYYGVDIINTDALIGEIAEAFTISMMDFGMSHNDELTMRLKEAIKDLLLWFQYTATLEPGFDAESDTAIVTLDITARPSLNTDNMEIFFLQEMMQYPGGQQGLVALGNEGLAEFFYEAIIKYVSSPVDYGLLDETAQRATITMRKDTSAGWVLEDLNDLTDLMMTF